VDTISKEGFSKTVVNKAPPRPDTSKMSDDEREKFMKAFVKKHESDIKKFGWLSKFDDSKAFLMEKTVLACEETANYLVIQCINLAMEEVRSCAAPPVVK
jgi:cell division cycle protein 37